MKRITPLRTLIEINDVSFFWYALTLILFFLLSAWSGEVSPTLTEIQDSLVLFVFVSGVLKFLFRLETLSVWVVKSIYDLRHGRFLARRFVWVFLRIEKSIYFLKHTLLAGETLEARLPFLSMRVFTSFLTLIFFLLIVERFWHGWTALFLHVNVNTLLLWLFMCGVVAIALNRKEDAAGMRYNQPVPMGMCVVVAIGGFGIIFLRLYTLGLLGMIIAAVTGILLFTMALAINDVHIDYGE